MEDFWNQNYALVDLLLCTNMSIADIAKELGKSQAEVSKLQKELGLGWIRRRQRKMSRGQAALTQIIQRLIPGEEIINEYHIGEQLRLDVYCPRYKIAAEYHGRQHFEFITRFHNTIEDFERAQKRDERKAELCREQGITLIAFRYNDQLSEDYVFDRLLNAIRDHDDKIEVKPRSNCRLKTRNTLSTKDNPYYEAAKERRKQNEKELRKKIKNERKKPRERL